MDAGTGFQKIAKKAETSEWSGTGVRTDHLSTFALVYNKALCTIKQTSKLKKFRTHCRI